MLGFCGGTSYMPAQVCNEADSGAFQMSDLLQCIKQCSLCARCNYISFSQANEDCSWYYRCDTLLHNDKGYVSMKLSDLGMSHVNTSKTDKWKVGLHTMMAMRLFRPPTLPVVRSTWPPVPRHFGEHVDLSVCMQYWGAPNRRTVRFAEGAANFLRQLAGRLLGAGMRHELLINSDSRHVRHGDVAALVEALRPWVPNPGGFVILSPNLGESRAYNMLAKIARGAVLMFVQDDWMLNVDLPNGGWLKDAFNVLGGRHHDPKGLPAFAARGVGLLGADVGVAQITCFPTTRKEVEPELRNGSSARGVQCRSDADRGDARGWAGWARRGARHNGELARQVRYRTQRRAVDQALAKLLGSGSTMVGLEAFPCVTLGPLFVPRGLFLHVGGFNESLSQRGLPASLLDCDLSARVWAAGYAVVAARWPAPPMMAREASAAWHDHAGTRAAEDDQRCAQLLDQYARRFVGGFQRLAAKARQVSDSLSLCPRALGGGGSPGGEGGKAGLRHKAERRLRWRAGDGWARWRAPDAWLPDDPAMQVNYTFAVQYWGGGESDKALARLSSTVLPMLERLPWACQEAELSCELLVNSDSPHVRAGDAHALLSALSQRDSLLLSPNTHELRAYNRLALMARGAYIGFLQDDSMPPPPNVELSWLVHSASLFWRFPRAGAVGIQMGLFFVSAFDESVVGVQTLDDLPDKMPVCRTNATSFPAADGQISAPPSEMKATEFVRVEAMRCADVGPMFVRREAFLTVGGFNESGTVIGEPASVLVDCELQARLWVEGYAALYLGLQGVERWHHTEERRAWQHPTMAAGHQRRLRAYRERFETLGSAARRSIERKGRRTNAAFDCPRDLLLARPRTKFDCFVVGECNM